MTTPLPPDPIDSTRLPTGQADWARSLVKGYTTVLEALSPEERQLYTQIWKHLARYGSPATVRQFPGINRHLFVVEQMVASLSDRMLLWFDHDLHGILQCAPFSVLLTPHQIKVFGWEKVYATSFIDIPQTLLIYGPNVWLDIQSTCPRSGEPLSFRARMRDDATLALETPAEAKNWHVWLPLPDAPSPNAYPEFCGLRSKINAFNSLSDLETHRQYQTEGSGVIYTLEEAIYLGSCLLRASLRLLKPE